MRKAINYIHGIKAGFLIENDYHTFTFIYENEYNAEPVSLTMPVNQKNYFFNDFPPVFEDLLPEGIMLEAILKINKLDKNDCFSQLIADGNDVIGAVTVKLFEDELVSNFIFTNR